MQARAATVVALLALLVVPIGATSGHAATNDWVQLYSGLGGDNVPTAVAAYGSAVYVTGSSEDASHKHSDVATVAYGADGTQLWAARYSASANSNDGGGAVAVSPDGTTVFVTGYSKKDYLTVAYSAVNGIPLWTKRYSFYQSLHGQGTAIAVSPDGSTVYVGGDTYQLNPLGDFDGLLALNATNGRVRWANWIDASPPLPKGFAVSPDGLKIAVLASVGFAPGDLWTIDTATGDEKWHKQLPKDIELAANVSVAVSPDSSTVYAGGSVAQYEQSELAAYTADKGSLLWKAFPKSTDGIGGMVMTPDGSKLITTGSLYRKDFSGTFATSAFATSSGAQLWTDDWDGAAKCYDVGLAIAVSSDGSQIYAMGVSDDGSSCSHITQQPMVTLIYGADGSGPTTDRFIDPVCGDGVGSDWPSIAASGGAVSISQASPLCKQRKQSSYQTISYGG